MLTRFVRTQLVVFTIASIIGLTAMVFVYMQVPTMLGVGRFTVTLHLPDTGGLYRFSNVTDRGVQVGRVTRVDPTAAGATAELSLDTSPRIPADVQANVRSVSAVGEQYVDLMPRAGGPPFLQSVRSARRVLSRVQRRRLRPGLAHRLRIPYRGRRQGHCRKHQDPVRRLGTAAGFPSAKY